jgi:hypothetical protein
MENIQKYSVAYTLNTKFIEIHWGVSGVEHAKGRRGT